jgi:thiol-disulfide isomerase/thioredoxin
MKKFWFVCAFFLGWGLMTELSATIGMNVKITQAQAIPQMEFFYGSECPHCHDEIKWFPELQKMYPDLQIKKYEVWHNPSHKILWKNRMQNLGTKTMGVPTNIIGDEVVIGFDPQAIVEAFEKQFGPPAQKTILPKIKDEGWRNYLQSSWPMMSIVLGFLDGFNPCAMWTLFILIGFLLSMEDRKKRWLIGGIFVGSSAIIYFAALLMYLFGFTEISQLVSGSIMTWVFRIVGIIAVGTGISSLLSSRKSSLECTVRDAESKRTFRKKLSEIIAQEKMPILLIGVIGLAFSVNAIELLCSFAIPTTFTATLVSLKLSLWEQLLAISLYDILYMLDDIVILVIALWTLNLKTISPKFVQISHFIGGLLLLILGGFLLFDPSLLANWIG